MTFRLAAIGIDLGGTTANAGLVVDGKILPDSVLSLPSQQSSPVAAISETLNRLIHEELRFSSANQLEVRAIGLAVPGPFDYKTGTSLMKHKFASLNGMALPKLINANGNLPIVFLNDAESFGRGAFAQYPVESPQRLLGITLGTGLGASYVDAHDAHDAELWKMPWKGGILEDYVSRRFIENGFNGMTAKEVAHLALTGDQAAREIFTQMGENLGAAIAPYANSINASIIAIGGGIARSWTQLLREPMLHAFAGSRQKDEIPHVVALPGDNTAIIGAGNYAAQQLTIGI